MCTRKMKKYKLLINRRKSFTQEISIPIAAMSKSSSIARWLLIKNLKTETCSMLKLQIGKWLKKNDFMIPSWESFHFLFVKSFEFILRSAGS